MKTRTVAIFTGQKFEVPERIQRIDSSSTHGWQVRYGRPSDDRTEMFSDFTPDGSGAAESLEKAKAALLKRVRRLQAPSGLKKNVSSTKAQPLPAGISGPTLRNGNNPRKTAYYCFQVSVPIYGRGNTTKSFYIGTENTATEQKREEALRKAMEFRADAERKYELAKTRAKRTSAVELLSAAK